jgi:hypothetical protein
MKRAYRQLLTLYPYDFRAAFAAEMMATVETNGRMLVAELAGLSIGAAREWFAKLTTNEYVRGRTLPDVRMMRPAGISREIWFARCSPDI